MQIWNSMTDQMLFEAIQRLDQESEFIGHLTTTDPVVKEMRRAYQALLRGTEIQIRHAINGRARVKSNRISQAVSIPTKETVKGPGNDGN